MMVYTKTYPAPPIDRDEVRRYAGMKTITPEVDALLDEVIAECSPLFTYTVCFTALPLTVQDAVADFGAFAVRSQSLCRAFCGCRRAVAFAATIGLSTDRLLTKYTHAAPAKAVLLSALGTERVERLCDAFAQDIAVEYGCTTSRFSAGYGDCPLSLQRDLFRVLDPARRIGVTLNDSLMMSPVKSVTALIGIGDNEGTPHGCAACDKTDCVHRRNV